MKNHSSEKQLSIRSSLNKHNLTYTVEKPHKCTVCEKQFIQNGNLQAHTLSAKNIMCRLREKQFSQNSNLKSHLLTHTGEQRFKCSVSEKPFTIKTDLKAHLLTHTGEKSFKCSLCENNYF